jgi:hypothetical protein
MKSAAMDDLRESEAPLRKKVKRVVRPARKTAPAPETLRGWAKSGIKARNKS